MQLQAVLDRPELPRRWDWRLRHRGGNRKLRLSYPIGRGRRRPLNQPVIRSNRRYSTWGRRSVPNWRYFSHGRRKRVQSPPWWMLRRKWNSKMDLGLKFWLWINQRRVSRIVFRRNLGVLNKSRTVGVGVLALNRLASSAESCSCKQSINQSISYW